MTLTNILTIAALSTSIALNILQIYINYRQRKKLETSYRRAGTFQNGELMDDILDQCVATTEVGKSPAALQIIADLAGYGAFTHFNKFEKYLNAVRRRCDDGRNAVECIFLEEEKKKEVLRIQFKNFDALKRTKPIQDKMEGFMSNRYGRQALKALGLEEKALKPEHLSLDEWLSIELQIDRLIMRDLQKWGVQIWTYPHLFTIHLWSGSTNKSLMAIVDYEGIVNENGFVAEGDISGNIRNIFDIIHKGASPWEDPQDDGRISVNGAQEVQEDGGSRIK